LSKASRRERIAVSLAVATVLLVLLGTPLASYAFLSVHDEMDVTVEPGSYHAVHVGLYGIGTYEMSLRTTSSFGFPVCIIVLDRLNYDRFVAGEDYVYEGFTSGGSGTGTYTGILWERYLVIFNDESTPVTVSYKYEMVSYFSVPLAVLFLTVAGAVSYVLFRRITESEGSAKAPGFAKVQKRERVKAIVSISCIALLALAGTYAAYYALLTDSPDGPFGNLWAVIIARYVMPVAALAVVYALRFKLSTVPEAPSEVLSKLAHQLRASGMRVKEERSGIAVQASSLVEVKVLAKATPEGTRVLYAAYATPAGWAIVMVFVLLFAWVSLAASFYILYRSAVFSGGRVYPVLSGTRVNERAAAVVSTRDMLIDSLSEARRLSAESYEAAKSNYHDALIMLALGVSLISIVVALLLWFYLPDDFTRQARGMISIGTGLAVGVAVSLVTWWSVATDAKPRMQSLKQWSKRLESALYRETEASAPPDAEASSLELIIDSYRQLPTWLSVRRRAGMFREPGTWMLIFLCSYMGVPSGVGGAVALFQGNLTVGGPLLAISALLLSFSAFLYIRWRRLKAKEDSAVSADWTARLDSLNAEMEAYLRGV